MIQNIGNLDSQSAYMLRTLSAEKGNVFTTKDAFRLLKLSHQGVYDRLSDLVQRRWIVRLKNGTYFICPLETGDTGNITEHEFVIASKLITPYAIGFWSALNHQGLTEQIPDRIYILGTHRTSKPVRTLGTATYQIVLVPKCRFFGQQEIWLGSQKVVITDLEKTIVDSVSHPEYCGGMIEVVKSFKAAKNRLDFAKLTQYAKRMQKGVIFKRMGILLDHLEPNNEHLKLWEKNVSEGISLFDPQGNSKGPMSSRWNIQLNFNLREFSE